MRQEGQELRLEKKKRLRLQLEERHKGLLWELEYLKWRYSRRRPG